MPVDIHMYEINCFGEMAKMKDTVCTDTCMDMDFCPLTDVSDFFSSR